MQIKNLRTIKNKSFSVGGGLTNAVSLKKLTEICEIITKNKIKIKAVKGTAAYDIPYFVTSNLFVTKTYNWKPRKSLLNVAKDVYEWQIKNYKSLKSILN